MNDINEDIKILEGLLGFISVLNMEQRQALENLIKGYRKQQAEIKDYGEEYNHWVHKAVTRAIELEKKDKIIDEMVYYLSDFDIDEMCEQCECCIGNGCHADDDVEFKMRCIKEYFKKKVEDNQNVWHMEQH